MGVRRISLTLIAVLLTLLACVPAASAAAPNAADRNVVWSDCDDVVALTDAQLASWQARGVGGFVCMAGWLHSMGGEHDWAPAGSVPDGDAYALEHQMIDTRIIERLKRHGMKAYLGFYATNYWNHTTPFAPWGDDAAWDDQVLPTVRRLATAAHTLGFAGVAMDDELYSQDGGDASATWGWRYPGSGSSQSAVRAAVRKRGSQLMHALLDGFPRVEVLAYGVMLPHSWGELVQKRVNDVDFGGRVDIDLWNGLASVPGYAAIRLADATFYKSPHFGTWDQALRWNLESLYAYLSRKISNWDYASEHLYVSPFAWIDKGPGGDWEAARDPSYVADQLDAFRKWGMGGEFATYAYAGLDGFDYSAYTKAMRSAARGGVVDREPPRLTVSRHGLTLSGSVADNMAVRAVHWHARGGLAGTARLTWHADRGTSWTIRLPRAARGRITVTAEDIKGLTKSRHLVR